MSHYDFWVHGTSVQVEFPEKTTLIARQGSGTIVRQDSGSNWFHFPIPVPSVIHDERVYYHDAWLHYEELTNARPKRVHVREGALPMILFETDANWKEDPARTRPEDLVAFDLPDNLMTRQGAALSVEVEFFQSGSIKLLAAGMRFDKR